jgi:chromosome segregation ATPase
VSSAIGLQAPKIYGFFSSKQELEKKQEELKTLITDLRKEINQRNLEIKSLREDLESNARRNELDAKSLEQLREQIEILKVCML